MLLTYSDTALPDPPTMLVALIRTRYLSDRPADGGKKDVKQIPRSLLQLPDLE